MAIRTERMFNNYSFYNQSLSEEFESIMKNRKYIIITVSVAVILGTTAFGIFKRTKPDEPKYPQSYAKLLAIPDAELAQLDIAVVNLLCAQGLSGSENLDIEASIKILDEWAELMKQSEQKYSAGFFQNRKKYNNSYAMFQAVNLGLTLKEDLKCRYNQELVDFGVMEDIQSTRFFKDSRDIFIHGFTEKQTGSCSFLPVLMVTIGRRCGYPLYLVPCKGHLFCRWDDGKERFNIETACPGVDSKPDSYYMRWPHPSSHAEIQSEKYLKSLMPREELGLFFDLRGACLQSNQQFFEAIESYNCALKSFPESKYIRNSLAQSSSKMKF
jgi:hypothetical protein